MPRHARLDTPGALHHIGEHILRQQGRCPDGRKGQVVGIHAMKQRPQSSMRELGTPAAEIARYVGVNTSSVSRGKAIARMEEKGRS